jgi:uncharacterized membrane protein
MSGRSRRGRPRPAFPLKPLGTSWPDDIDLLLVIFASLIAAIGFAFDLPIWIRLPVGLLATVALPGYALGMAVFPPGRLDGAERAALSFSLSVGAIVLAAPIINLAPGGLSERAVVASISAITIGAAAVAWWRRRNMGGAANDDSKTIGSTTKLGGGDVRRRLVLVVAGLAVIAVASTLTRGAGSEQPTATEFYLLRAPGTSTGVLERVVTGMPTGLLLGITNHDSAVQTFQIVVRSPTGGLASRGPIVVAPDETWNGQVSFALTEPGSDVEIQVLLYRDSEGQPYRSLRVVVDAVAPS